MESGGDWEVRRHRVALWGRITDSSGAAVCGVLVRLTEGPSSFELRAPQFRAEGDEERPDVTRSRRDGLYFFLDLPPGEYAVEASGDRERERAVKRGKVGLNKDGSIRAAVADLVIPRR